MKIIYFTTAQRSEDFKNSLPKWKVSPNLSNQNFHNKMIRALSLSHEVIVVSIRPINSNFSEKCLQKATIIENNVTWNYIKVSTNKIDKYLFVSSRVKAVLKNFINKDDIIFVDTMSIHLMIQAKGIRSKYGCKVIGVCTDNPDNISYSSPSYKKQLLNHGRDLDGYISLTPKIDELYNTKNKKSIIIDGITEQATFSTNINIDGEFMFFGGSLMKKYGVYSLMEAFNQINNQRFKLVLCGHHEENGFKETVESYKNVVYLGALSYEDVCALERKAFCAINPRPIDEKIDDYSIPSKTLEYLSNGVLTITVSNKLLMQHYSDAIIWSSTGDIADLKIALNKAIDMSKEERSKKINLGKKLIQENTSFESINRKIEQLF